jgi:ATP-dependent Zn protease
MKEKLNNETQRIMQECFHEVEAMLQKEDAILERFKDELLKRNELEYDDIEAIFSEFGRQRVFAKPDVSPS